MRLVRTLITSSLVQSLVAPELSVFATGNHVETKEKRNTYIRPCPDQKTSVLFPLDADPDDWPSCHDAYEFSWVLDPGNHLPELSAKQKLKLGRSMGFCPHRRCQLGTVRNADRYGQCPQGLCFTKLEDGAATFGACCFTDGVFNSGGVIGYYDLLRTTPKPIYKRNRVVLGGDVSDESKDSFINANEVVPGIIIMQCPVTRHPPDAITTLEATERMFVEQGVELVLQVDPFVAQAEGQALSSLLQVVSRRGCSVWPPEVYGLEEARGGVVVEAWRPEQQLVVMSYDPAGPSFSASSGAAAASSRGRVKHMWFYGWNDFSVPVGSAVEGVRAMVEEAWGALKRGGGAKVAVTCFAGRGRSGTLAAVIAGLLGNVTTDDALIDIIVAMRESRDGLVETPEQYAFVRRLLGIRRGSEVEPGDEGRAEAAQGASVWRRQLALWVTATGAWWRLQDTGVPLWVLLFSVALGAGTVGFFLGRT